MIMINPIRGAFDRKFSYPILIQFRVNDKSFMKMKFLFMLVTHCVYGLALDGMSDDGIKTCYL